MTERSDDPMQGRRSRRIALLVIAAVAGGAAGLAAVYGIGAFQRNAAVTAGCEPALEAARRIAPLARGEVAALSVATAPRRVPPLAFTDGAGQTRYIAEWQGRFVLVNLWATWCVPCRKEMPTLDALEAKLGGPSFDVVAIDIDTRDTDKPRAWLAQAGVSHLGYYADPTARVFQDLKAIGLAFGMPTTIIVDPRGCEIANLAGPAEWASEDAVKLIAAAIRP